VVPENVAVFTTRIKLVIKYVVRILIKLYWFGIGPDVDLLLR